MADEISLIPGKWYVLDRFSHPDNAPVAGPFDDKAAAEKERQQLNIAGDCVVKMYKPRNHPMP